MGPIHAAAYKREFFCGMMKTGRQQRNTPNSYVTLLLPLIPTLSFLHWVWVLKMKTSKAEVGSQISSCKKLAKCQMIVCLMWEPQILTCNFLWQAREEEMVLVLQWQWANADADGLRWTSKDYGLTRRSTLSMAGGNCGDNSSASVWSWKVENEAQWFGLSCLQLSTY